MKIGKKNNIYIFSEVVIMAIELTKTNFKALSSMIEDEATLSNNTTSGAVERSKKTSKNACEN